MTQDSPASLATLLVDPAGTPFDLHVSGSTVHVSGDIDLVTAPRLENTVRGAVTAGTAVRLDLSGVEFFSSAGVTALENVLRDLPGGIEAVIAPSPRVLRTLTILGLDRSVPVVADSADLTTH
ncbi:STAS domain-containing protein [Rhodococcoides corynebacterioides]|uniref:STAS domain-containing protein n=1 Tax=Rhodococcoides corynebacterioides TaxID=53972 RepID=UPI003F7E6223